MSISSPWFGTVTVKVSLILDGITTAPLKVSEISQILL